MNDFDDTPIPARPSRKWNTGEREAIRYAAKKRMPWTVICVVANTFIAVALFAAKCGPASVNWKFPTKEELRASEDANSRDHVEIKSKISGMETRIDSIDAGIKNINATLDKRLPKRK